MHEENKKGKKEKMLQNRVEGGEVGNWRDKGEEGIAPGPHGALPKK